MWITYFPQCDNFAIIDTKCDTKDTLCNDHDDTCATMLETLEMSVIEVFMIRTTHLHKNYPLNTPRLACVQCATLNMLEVDTSISSQMGPEHLEKTHALTLNIFNDNMQSQSRL